MAIRIVPVQKRHDTAANWTLRNPILRMAEEGFETDTKKEKIGDGVTPWNSLPYKSTGGSGGSGATSLTELTDVEVTGPQNGDTLMRVLGTFVNQSSTQVKSIYGLNNVNNTSDADKPLSTAATNALAGKANLVAGKIPTSEIPAVALTEFLGTVASQAAMLALTGQRGDWAIRSDQARVYILTADNASVLANWQVFEYPTGASAVNSVNGQTGTVVLGKANIGLGNADDTSDAAKPLSTAATNALAGKANLVGGKVPASELPSFVDDVIEVANYAALPGTGEAGKIYITTNDGKQFRWTGSIYAPTGGAASGIEVVQLPDNNAPSSPVVNTLYKTQNQERGFLCLKNGVVKEILLASSNNPIANGIVGFNAAATDTQTKELVEDSGIDIRHGTALELGKIFFKLDANGLTTKATPVASDFVVGFDTAGNQNSKFPISALGGSGQFNASGSSILIPQYSFGDDFLVPDPNKIYLTRIEVKVPTTLDALSFRRYQGGSGNLGFGVFSIDGATRYMTTGAVSAVEEDVRILDLTIFTVPIGFFWFAYTADNASAQIRATSFTSAQQQLVYNAESSSAIAPSAWVAVAGNSSAGGVLPATLTGIITPFVGQAMPIAKLFKK